jgi:membrane protein YdbS with pleckstrin-like domain
MKTSRRTRVMRLVRVAITAFVVLLLAVVTMGWIWTGSHQPPPLRTASHVVLSIAAFAGIFALATIWRPDRS